MPPDTTLRSRRSRPWYATDSGRAGLVLSAVTIAVLAIGVAVIQSARSNDTSEPSSAHRQDAGPAIPTPAPRADEEQVIVLTGSPPTPTQLPATTPESSTSYQAQGYQAEGATLPYTADRPRDNTTDRL